MTERQIHAVHDRDLEKLLESLKLLNDLRAGKIKCGECQCAVSEENLGFLYPYEGKIRICCDKADCFYNATKKLSAENLKAGKADEKEHSEQV